MLEKHLKNSYITSCWWFVSLIKPQKLVVYCLIKMVNFLLYRTGKSCHIKIIYIKIAGDQSRLNQGQLSMLSGCLSPTVAGEQSNYRISMLSSSSRVLCRSYTVRNELACKTFLSISRRFVRLRISFDPTKSQSGRRQKQFLLLEIKK